MPQATIQSWIKWYLISYFTLQVDRIQLDLNLSFVHLVIRKKDKKRHSTKTCRLSSQSIHGRQPFLRKKYGKNKFFSHYFCDLNQISEIGFVGKEVNLTADIARQLLQSKSTYYSQQSNQVTFYFQFSSKCLVT